MSILSYARRFNKLLGTRQPTPYRVSARYIYVAFYREGLSVEDAVKVYTELLNQD